MRRSQLPALSEVRREGLAQVQGPVPSCQRAAQLGSRTRPTRQIQAGMQALFLYRGTVRPARTPPRPQQGRLTTTVDELLATRGHDADLVLEH